MSLMQVNPGDVRFRVLAMNCKRVRIEAITQLPDKTLWAVHKDIGPDITERDTYDAVHMLLYRTAQRMQKESEG